MSKVKNRESLKSFAVFLFTFIRISAEKCLLLSPSGASLMVQRLKCLPAMWETWVQSLGQEDPLEKETATHSSILPGESHGRRSLVGCSPRGRKEWDTTERHHFHFHFAPVRPELYNNVGVPGGVDGKNLPALQETRV